jgi:phenylacetate-coenzyme A ligase PaaK-like adenylate-forming protein
VHLPIPELVTQLNEYQPALLQGYASTIALLAEEQEAGRLHISPAVVLPSSEGLTDKGYDKIAKAFNAKVGTAYGGTEVGAIAWGCEFYWLHLSSDWAITEPVDANFQPVPPGVQSYTVLVSNLANHVQPILRYDMGDSILVRPDPCPCGRPTPAIRVQGRVADMLIFPAKNGDKIRLTSLQFATLFDRTPEVQLFQIVQTSPTTLRVRLRTAEGADKHAVWQKVEGEIDKFLHSNELGNIQVELAAELPEQNVGGKYREIIPLNISTEDESGKCLL